MKLVLQKGFPLNSPDTTRWRSLSTGLTVGIWRSRWCSLSERRRIHPEGVPPVVCLWEKELAFSRAQVTTFPLGALPWEPIGVLGFARCRK
ncbi:MAG: hypothetical protein KME30_17440 [Iphinoe sp. HA4291-MV1]|nr:hypothetical protein [Iphinoe sp. HA4291-MV1]